jgi:hypothetical protein
MNIPLIGKLFTSSNTENKTEDLLVVLVPHIMRSPDLTAANVRAVASGNDTVWKVGYRHQAPQISAKPPAQPDKVPQSDARPQAAVPVVPGAAAAGPPLNAMAPAPPPAPPAGTQPASQPTEPSLAAVSPKLEKAAQPGAPAGVTAVMVPSAADVTTGSTVTVDVNVSNVKDLAAAPMRVKYDAALLKLVEVKAGGFLGELGKQLIFSEVRSRQGGETKIQLQRLAGAGGVDGSGTLLTLKFEAKSAGLASISMADFSLRDSKLQSLQATPPQTSVVVK